MSYRRRLHHPDSVGALNSIEVVFSDDDRVRSKLKELLDHMEREPTLPSAEKQVAYQRRDDLTTELISTISESLGYKFDHTAIKSSAYLPQGMVDEGEYLLEMRRRMLLLTEDGSVPVKLVAEESESNGLGMQLGVQHK